MVNPHVTQASGNSPTKSQQRVGGLPVTQSPQDPTKWHLLIAQCLFQRLCKPHVDLFDSHWNHQPSCWFSWTGHLTAAAFNTLSQPWTGLSLYSFPLIPLLEMTLIKIMEDQAEEVIVIILSSPRRSWYNLFLQITCEIPLLLTCRWDLCHNTCPTRVCSTTLTWRLSSSRHGN